MRDIRHGIFEYDIRRPRVISRLLSVRPPSYGWIWGGSLIQLRQHIDGVFAREDWKVENYPWP